MKGLFPSFNELLNDHEVVAVVLDKFKDFLNGLGHAVRDVKPVLGPYLLTNFNLLVKA